MCAILSLRGEVRVLLEKAILQEEGLRDSQAYNWLLQAIGADYTELNKIGQQNGMVVSTPY